MVYDDDTFLFFPFGVELVRIFSSRTGSVFCTLYSKRGQRRLFSPDNERLDWAAERERRRKMTRSGSANGRLHIFPVMSVSAVSFNFPPGECRESERWCCF